MRVENAFGKRVLVSDSWREPNCGDGSNRYCQTCIFIARYVLGNHAGKAGFTTDVRTWNGKPWTRKAGTAAAAVPGTSNHGGGVAIDAKTARSAGDSRSDVVFTSFSDPDRLRWLAVAKDHGWADDEGKRVDEHWHMTYYPERDKHRNNVTKQVVTVGAPTLTGLPTLDLRSADVVATTGPYAKRLQEALRAAGYKITADGVAGPATKAALGAFQKAKNLGQDYICGPKTWAALGVK